MMAFNVMDLVAEEERPDLPDIEHCYVVDPAAMYPAVIGHIQDVLESGRAMGPHMATHLTDARRLPREAWHLALIPKGQLSDEQRALSPDFVPTLVAGDDTLQRLGGGELLRAIALEVARRWFTAVLHAAVGNAPMNIHIIKDEDWRL
jgi:hypothetical protein